MRSAVQRKSYGSVTVFWLDREAALQNVRDAARRFAAADPSVRRVILFGSLATGRATAASDADILVILSHTDVSLLDRPTAYAHYFAGTGLPAELFVYTQTEVHSHPTSIAEHALAHGLDMLAPGGTAAPT